MRRVNVRANLTIVIPARCESIEPGMTDRKRPLDIATYAILLAGAFAGGFVSGLTGFGTALMALGIWLYAVPPAIAVPLVLICSVAAQLSTLPAMWRLLDFKLAWPFVAGGLLGMPIGALLVARADPQIFKLSVGVMLLVFPAALYFMPRASRSVSAENRLTPRSDLPAAFSAASPAFPARFRFCGPACAAGARTSAAAFSRSSTASCSAPRFWCRWPAALSTARCSGWRCWRCQHVSRRLDRRAHLPGAQRPQFLRPRAGPAVRLRPQYGVEQHCSELSRAWPPCAPSRLLYAEAQSS